MLTAVVCFSATRCIVDLGVPNNNILVKSARSDRCRFAKILSVGAFLKYSHKEYTAARKLVVFVRYVVVCRCSVAIFGEFNHFRIFLMRIVFFSDPSAKNRLKPCRSLTVKWSEVIAVCTGSGLHHKPHMGNISPDLRPDRLLSSKLFGTLLNLIPPCEYSLRLLNQNVKNLSNVSLYY